MIQVFNRWFHCKIDSAGNEEWTNQDPWSEIFTPIDISKDGETYMSVI